MMEANRSGASAYVTKPFRTERLLQTVRDVLRDASVYYDEISGLAHAGQRPGRDTAPLVRSHPARRPLRDSGRRARARAAAGLRGRRRGLSFDRQASLRDARPPHPQRRLRLHLEPRERVSRHPRSVPGRGFVDGDDLRHVKRRLEEQLLGFLEDELEKRASCGTSISTWATRASDSRPRCASGAPCSKPSSAPPAASRSRAAARSSTV